MLVALQSAWIVVIQDSPSDFGFDSNFNGDHDEQVTFCEWGTLDKHETKVRITFAISSFKTSVVYLKKNLKSLDSNKK